MKFLNTLLLLAILATASADVAISATPVDQDETFLETTHETNVTQTSSVSVSSDSDQIPITSSLRGTDRVFGNRFRKQMTCNKFPRVCDMRGSPGPDCCKKKCVNVMEDRVNCGMCGKKCRYWEICCQGRCVNPSTDWKHCGGCFNSCAKGSSCAYGMCSYA